MHDLQACIDRQEKRLAQLEAKLARVRGGEDEIDELSRSLDRMERATRRALRNLYDPARLADGDLACLFAEVSGYPMTGHELQALLRDAISMLEPAQTTDGQFHRTRCYNALISTYLEKDSVAEITRRLAISRRQYYRDLKVAVRSVAGYLFSTVATI